MYLNVNVLAGCVLIGFIVATCGAWKDTLFEPFSMKKFFRSPLVLGLWGLVVALIYVHQPTILCCLAAGSLERLTIEGWKAIIRKAPGKFALPERDSGWIKKTRWIGPKFRNVDYTHQDILTAPKGSGQ